MTDVLIVDDDATFGQLTLERIETMGWNVAFHLGPFGTLKAIRAARPRLLILDVNMPGLDGPKIAEMLRECGELERMRVLLMSSLDQQELARMAKQHHMDSALHKSATRADLRKKIDILLGPPER